MVQRMIEDLMPYFASQITFDNTQVKAALGPEALAWKLDIDFLKKMAKSYYRQTSPGLVAEQFFRMTLLCPAYSQLQSVPGFFFQRLSSYY